MRSRGADLVACEDTRRAGRLYERLEIRPPRLVSNHDGNEAERAPQLAQEIERGARVALISDAGMPGISDPGYRLIRTCIDRDLDVEVLPGPSSIPVAVVVSGAAGRQMELRGLPSAPRRRAGARAALGRDGGRLRVAAPAARLARGARRARARTGRRPSAASSRSSTRRSRAARWRSWRGASAASSAARSSSSSARPVRARARHDADMTIAVDALRRLVQSGARPRAAAGVVATLTGTRPNDLYRALTGREPRE